MLGESGASGALSSHLLGPAEASCQLTCATDSICKCVCVFLEVRGDDVQGREGKRKRKTEREQMQIGTECLESYMTQL